MSKLLKAVLTKHRPHIAARMTKENGYDEQKHLLTPDLKTAGIINKPEADDIDVCVDEMSDDGSVAGAFLNAAKAGRADKTKLNDDDFIKALMEADGGMAEDGDLDDLDNDDDEGEGDDLPKVGAGEIVS